MFSSQTVDELISCAEHSALHLCMYCLVRFSCGYSRDLLSSGLDEGVETVSAGLKSFFEESDLSLVALFLGNGGH